MIKEEKKKKDAKNTIDRCRYITVEISSSDMDKRKMIDENRIVSLWWGEQNEILTFIDDLSFI